MDLQVYKHSDRFNGGIADLHLIHPIGHTAWLEFKWVPICKRQRKAGVTALQEEFLKEHAAAGIPAFVVIGSKDGMAIYHIDAFDGTVYAEDLWKDDEGLHSMMEEIFTGGKHGLCDQSV